jgi:alcohol dehydrogenase (cytochrome c)
MSHLLKKVSLAVVSACACDGACRRPNWDRYAPVTDARLSNPEASNWLMYRGNYQGWGYSSLEKINTGNVKEIGLGLVLFYRRH